MFVGIKCKKKKICISNLGLQSVLNVMSFAQAWVDVCMKIDKYLFAWPTYAIHILNRTSTFKLRYQLNNPVA